MKTCILLSGLPRQLKVCNKNILNCLVYPNNADVFVHAWNPTEDISLFDSIKDLYSPKDIIIDSPKKFVNDGMQLDRMMAIHANGRREYFVEMLHSSWYSILMSNTIKELYRLRNNIQYDWVIRARFDIIYNKPIILSEYNSNALYVSSRPDLPPEMIDDRFAFSSEKIMNVYCSGFNLLNYIHGIRDKIDGIFCGETLVHEMNKLFKFNPIVINDLVARKIG